jgi:murein DD-endopeptidase MepM/ murein hydrolase activator NlpD
MWRQPLDHVAAKRLSAVALVVVFHAMAGCGGGGGSSGSLSDPQAACGPYPPEAASPYVLPYEVGTARTVSQGNCSNFSHKPGTGDQYAYDFLMPIGTPIIASRPGTVTRLVTEFMDNTGVPGEENVVGITHEDGSQALYFHIAQDGALVTIGQLVRTGDVIALSGNSGASTEPHLHFVVIGSRGTPSPGTLPITFSNTRAHPSGLQQGERYTALPYE